MKPAVENIDGTTAWSLQFKILMEQLHEACADGNILIEQLQQMEILIEQTHRTYADGNIDRTGK